MIKNKLIIIALVKIILLLYLDKSFANQCTDAIQKTSQETKIPYDILTAVALTETGTLQKGKLAPYPWAVNVQGKGFLFTSKQQAINAVKLYLSQGITSIDIGCMQMNWYWHKDKFDNSVEKAFDPETNIKMGAKYILEHYHTYGDWDKAVGRYHSGTDKFAKAYHQKYALNLKIARNNLNNLDDYLFETGNKDTQIASNTFNKTAGSLIQFNMADEKTIAFIDMAQKSIPIIDTRRKKFFFKALHQR
jgi:soluble lytic murein transglycosylase-like protein